MDLSHGLPFIPPVKIRPGDYSDCADANLKYPLAPEEQAGLRTSARTIRKALDRIKAVLQLGGKSH